MYRKILLFILSIACGSGVSAQTWQKALEGAQKALSRPGAATVSSSRAALLNARMGMTLPASQGVGLWVDRRLSPLTPVLSNRLRAWAVLSNRLMLKDQPLREKQLQFFASHDQVPQGVLAAFPGTPLDFPHRLGEKTQYVLFGGKEGDLQMEALFKKFALQYRKAFADKKVIILSGTLPDRGVKFASELYADEKDRGFIRSFVREGFSVAGIGDAGPKPEGYLQQEKTNLIISAAEVPAAEAARSLHLYRSLAKWKEAFPQAVFLIYVSPMAAAYDWRYSLANALPKEAVFSVSLTSVRNTKEFLFHRWNNFAYAKPGVLVWNDEVWARMSGFDAQMIAP